VFTIGDQIDDQTTIFCSKIDNVEVAGNPCDPTPITGPTTLAVAGHYCLSESFSVGSGDGITVTASNVVLDLNNKTISGTGGDNGVVITGDEVTVKKW